MYDDSPKGVQPFFLRRFAREGQEGLEVSVDQEACCAAPGKEPAGSSSQAGVSKGLACSSVTWGGSPDVARMLAEVKQAGYTGIELQQSMEWLGDSSALKRMLEAEGLQLAAFYYGSALLAKDAEEMDRHRRAIDYAAALGTEMYMVAGGWLKGARPEPEHYAMLGANLSDLTEYASDRGLVLSYHHHMGSIVETLEQIDMLLENAPNLTLCPDVAHLVAAGSDPVQTILRHGDRITHLHLKDYEQPPDGVYSGAYFVELGEGDSGLDFPAILSALDQVGYHGWTVIELDTTRKTPFASALQSINYLRQFTGG